MNKVIKKGDILFFKSYALCGMIDINDCIIILNVNYGLDGYYYECYMPRQCQFVTLFDIEIQNKIYKP